MMASLYGKVETADLLLCSGANVNQTSVSAFIHVRVSYRGGSDGDLGAVS